VEFAKGGNIIEAGIGARVGNHYEAGPNENSAAIGHGPDFRKILFSIAMSELVLGRRLLQRAA
jgi:hypothetical protein